MSKPVACAHMFLSHVTINPLCSSLPTWRKIANVAAITFVVLSFIYYFRGKKVSQGKDKTSESKQINTQKDDQFQAPLPTDQSSTLSKTISTSPHKSEETCKSEETWLEMQIKVTHNIALAPNNLSSTLLKALSNDETAYNNNHMIALRFKLNQQALELNLPLMSPDKNYIYSTTKLQSLFLSIQTQSNSAPAHKLKNAIVDCLDSIYLLLKQLSVSLNNSNSDTFVKSAILFAHIYYAFRQNAIFILEQDTLSFTAQETPSEDHAKLFYQPLPKTFEKNYESHARVLFNDFIIMLHEKKTMLEIEDLLKNSLFQQDYKDS